MYIWGPVMILHQHKRSFTAGYTVTVYYEIWIWRACNARVRRVVLFSSDSPHQALLLLLLLLLESFISSIVSPHRRVSLHVLRFTNQSITASSIELRHAHARALTSDPRMQIRDVTVLIVLMNYSYVSRTLFVSLSRWGLWNTDLLFCFRTEPMIFTYTLFINPNTRTHLACLWSTRLPLWGHQETLDLCSWLLPVLTSVMQCVTWHAGFVLQQVSLCERMKWICLVFVASMLMSEGVAMATAGEERLFFCVCCHGD